MISNFISMFSVAAVVVVAGYLTLCIVLYCAGLFEVRKSRLWLKRLTYDNFIATFMRHGLVQFSLISLTALYYITMDIWGDSLSFFVENSEVHTYVYFCLIPLNAIALFFSAIGASYIKTTQRYVELLEGYVKLTSSHVEQKILNLRDDTRKVTKQGDNLKAITHTPKTVHQLLTDTERLLQDHYRVDSDKLHVSIVRLSPYDNTWNYTHWHRADSPPIEIKRLMRRDLSSTELRAFNDEDAYLYVDKGEAASRGVYLKTRLDADPVSGSIFCFPIFTSLPSFTKENNVIEDVHIVSINMYDKMFCDPSNEDEIADVKKVLSGICRRLELELKYGSIIAWKAQVTAQGASENESID